MFHFNLNLSIKGNLDLGNFAISRISSGKKETRFATCLCFDDVSTRGHPKGASERASVTSLVLHVRGLTNRNRFRYIGTSLASGLDARASTRCVARDLRPCKLARRNQAISRVIVDTYANMGKRARNAVTIIR